MLLIILLIVLVIGVLWVLRAASAGKAAQDEVWQLEAKPVLSEPEQMLFQRLVAAYPDYIVLAQVALSQLLKVKPGTSNRESIRGRYKQLVADFVICRNDFTAVAVIELDDSSHERPDRQRADQTKNRALEAAGLRLVRIPVGSMPSQADLQGILQMGSAPYSTAPAFRKPGASLSMDRGSKAAVSALLTLAGVMVVLVGAWIVYTRAAASLPEVAAPATVVPVQMAVPKQLVPAAAPVDTAAIQAAEQKRLEVARAMAEQQAAEDLEKRKKEAWAAYYKPPASCEHPPGWQDQVECGNKYIRAKREFEKQWALQNNLPVAQ
jgi:hypothetical protein